MLKQAEQEVKREACARTVLARVRTLSKSFASSAAIGYNTISGKLFLERFRSSITPIPEEVRQLVEIGGFNTTEIEKLAKFAALIEDLRSSTERGIKLIERGDVQEGTAVLDSLTGLLAKVWSQSEEVVFIVRKVEEANPIVQNRSRTIVQATLWLGAIANIGLAIGLAIFFHRNTAARLSVLMENTTRLSKKGDLLPPVSGSDEIATLDSFFHGMAKDLSELDRMKKEFVSMISHDLRSPLTSFSMTLEMLEANRFGQLTEEGLAIVAQAGDTTKRLVRMINSLLDLDKMEAGKFSLDVGHISLSLVVNHAADAVRGWAMQQDVTLALEAEEVFVSGDSGKLTEAVTNLISNAIKYSPRNSTITISVKKYESSAEISVTDQGPGISPENQRAVFEPFHQLNDEQRKKTVGTGLGLAICKKIVEAHNGLIGIRSELGKGSTFWIRLKRLPGEDRDSASDLNRSKQ
jgi:signal transduction histidine kinase